MLSSLVTAVPPLNGTVDGQANGGTINSLWKIIKALYKERDTQLSLTVYKDGSYYKGAAYASTAGTQKTLKIMGSIIMLVDMPVTNTFVGSNFQACTTYNSNQVVCKVYGTLTATSATGESFTQNNVLATFNLNSVTHKASVQAGLFMVSNMNLYHFDFSPLPV